MLERISEILRRVLPPGFAGGAWPESLRDEAAFRESGADIPDEGPGEDRARQVETEGDSPDERPARGRANPRSEAEYRDEGAGR